MTLRKIFGFIATAVILIVAILIGRSIWVHYMDYPWTRDGRVRADVINIAPDVSGYVVELPVRDNQLVKKGDLIMQIDPSHYQIAVEQAQANVAARRAELQMRRDDAVRRQDLDAQVVSKENRENAGHIANSAEAQYQQALAALDAAKLNLERTRVIAPVDGYVTNLQVFKGDYAIVGQAKLALVDAHSFWVYGYFEETKLPRVKIGAKAEMRLMSGGVMKGHVQGIARGIYDRENPQARDLVADVNPVFNWVRLAQRVPVRIKIGAKAEMRLMSGGVMKGHVQGIARGIYDRENPQARDLVADVNPVFNWVRLAQRVPVRIKIDEVPDDVYLSAGTTCTVIVEQEKPGQDKQNQEKPKS